MQLERGKNINVVNEDTVEVEGEHGVTLTLKCNENCADAVARMLVAMVTDFDTRCD